MAAETTTVVACSLVDHWTERAQRAGLVWTDGWGSRSLLEGTAAQWCAFADALEQESADWTGGDARSAKAAIGRARTAARRALAL